MFKFVIALFLLGSMRTSYSDNQTPDISQVLPPDSLPFEVSIELADFSLPQGLQSFALGRYKDKCLLITGRVNGLHGFGPGNDNFLPNKQNTTVFVVDLKNQKVYQRSLLDENSNLTQEQVDSLSVTSPQYAQVNNTLYIVGGYGVETLTGQFSTKQTLTAIDLPGLIKWVQNPEKKGTAKKHIRQIFHPVFQVAGGYLDQMQPHDPFLLIFGQDFEGFYSDGSSGVYTQQVRSFDLFDNGEHLAVGSIKYKAQNSNYRRRDLNVIPIVQKQGKNYVESFMALSGVFTETGGGWTVPVFIDLKGNSFMPNPSDPKTFKQGMNNYASAHTEFFSKKTGTMYTLLLGGIGYQTCSNGLCTQDAELPFTNNVTSLSIKNDQVKQYLMQAEYPFIPSTFSNPGNALLFGTGAIFASFHNFPTFPKGAISIDDIKKDSLVGYIIGGIQSTLPNTNVPTDSAASPYIFKVFIKPK